MPTYNYQGRDSKGKLITGKRLSASMDSLSSLLLKEGIIPINISVVQAKISIIESLKQLIGRNKTDLDELGLFARQMYTLTNTGVPITIALRQLAANARTNQMANALYGVVEYLESGQDLASAMQRFPDIFSPIMVSMVRVGQEAGKLEDAFLRLNQYIELEGSSLKKVKAALRYPALIFTMMIVAIFFVNIFVVPTFSQVFTQSKIPLPFLTKALIASSNFFRNNWLVLSIGLLIAIVSFVYYLKTPQGKISWNRNLLKLPIFGNIFRRAILLRFSQAFAITINAGLPLLESLTLVAKALNNPYAYQEIIQIRDSITHGNNLTMAASASPLFTSLELQMLAVSEETGQVGPMLEQLATFYRREVDYDLKRITDLVEPALIIVLSVVIMVMAFAVYLPIWNMVKLVH